MQEILRFPLTPPSPSLRKAPLIFLARKVIPFLLSNMPAFRQSESADLRRLGDKGAATFSEQPAKSDVVAFLERRSIAASSAVSLPT
jgi:hypothetical protein